MLVQVMVLVSYYFIFSKAVKLCQNTHSLMPQSPPLALCQFPEIQVYKKTFAKFRHNYRNCYKKKGEQKWD